LTVTSFFPSRKRCCPQCCERRITIGKGEKERTVTEYYHRAVVAHLIGFDLPIVLDLEPILPGEDEIAAAKRLIERLMEHYARFFDVIQGDALYWEKPLFELCRQKGKYLLAVLKDNNPALLADARVLLDGEPDLIRQDENGRHIRYWDQEGFTSGAIQEPVRVLRTEENWLQRERVAHRWVETPRTSNWFWATDIPQRLIPSRQLAQAGHKRWKIENCIFNALGDWGLNHCYHHQPQAILNFLLILFIAYILLACFYQRNLNKQSRRIFSTLIGVAREILHGIHRMKARDVPWARGSPVSA